LRVVDDRQIHVAGVLLMAMAIRGEQPLPGAAVSPA
jgi:hypothetical protein